MPNARGGALSEVGARVPTPTGPLTAELAAAGFFEIANQSMSDAIQEVSVKRGYDVREHTLLVYGGAGGQHACALVARLGMRAAVFHPLTAVLSAYGIGRAELGWNGSRELGAVPVEDGALARLEPSFRELEARGRAALEADGAHEVRCERRVEVGYTGTEPATLLSFGDADALKAAFHARHEAEFGYRRPEHTVADPTPARRGQLRAPATPERPPRSPRSCRDRPGRVHAPLHGRRVAGRRARLRAPTPRRRRANPRARVDRGRYRHAGDRPGFQLSAASGGLLVAEPVEIAGRADASASSAPFAVESDRARAFFAPLHVDRGAHGLRASAQRRQREHPRAPGLLVRAVRS
jgi:hypothetical protein